MGSYADATAELTRLTGLEGVVARRDPISESANSGGTDNLVLAKDSRIGDEDRSATVVVDEALGGPTAWLKYEVGSAGTYPNSVVDLV